MLSPSLKDRSDPVGKRIDLLFLECGCSEVVFEVATEYVVAAIMESRAAPSMVDMAVAEVARQVREKRGRRSRRTILAELTLEFQSCHLSNNITTLGVKGDPSG